MGREEYHCEILLLLLGRMQTDHVLTFVARQDLLHSVFAYLCTLSGKIASKEKWVRPLVGSICAARTIGATPSHVILNVNCRRRAQ